MKSLVIPVYKNEGSLSELLVTLNCLGRKLENGLEVIFVIDGSPDKCEEILRKELSNFTFHSQLICHSRNFGSFAAIRTGMAAANGDLIAVMAADLQEPVELIEEFFRTLETEPYDVCLGTRRSRHDSMGTRISSAVFWYLYRNLVMPQIPAGGIDVFACTRNVARVICQFTESHSSLVAQIVWIGFRRKLVAYDRLPRKAGRSAWRIKHRYQYMLDSVFSFTDRPLKLITLIGIMGMLLSIVYGSILIVARLGGYIISGSYSALAVMILFSLFLNLFCMGIVGQYVWRIYENSKQRPLSIIRESVSFQASTKIGKDEEIIK